MIRRFVDGYTDATLHGAAVIAIAGAWLVWSIARLAATAL